MVLRTLEFGEDVLSFKKDHPGGARSAHARSSRTGLPGSVIETSKGRRAMNDWTGRALDERCGCATVPAPGLPQ